MLRQNLYKIPAVCLIISSLGALGQQVVSPAPGEDPATAQTRSAVPTTQAYRVGVDDILTINVWHEPDISRTVNVRPDGKISLPLVGEVQASGRTIMELQEEIRTSLGQYLKDPEVVVILTEMRSKRINVMGEVAKPGTFPLSQSMGVLDAIAVAGGLKEFAKKNKIYILRITPDGQRVRIRYNYSGVLKGKKNAQDITLQPRDTVVVP